MKSFADMIMDNLPPVKVPPINEIINGINNITKKPQEIDSSLNKHAQFADESYKQPKDRKDLNNYKYDSDLSTDTTAVYFDPVKQKVKISHRGTADLKDFLDYEDLHKGLDKNKNFIEAKNITKAAEAKHNAKKVKHIGHSKGGTFANQIAKSLGHKSVSLNGYNINHSDDKKHKSFCVVGDPICSKNLVKNPNEHLVKPSQKNPHSLSNFLW